MKYMGAKGLDAFKNVLNQARKKKNSFRANVLNQARKKKLLEQTKSR